MAGVDTNVLVRLLVRDDPAQTERVRALVERAATCSEPLFVPVTVTLELEWVLRSRYGYGRQAWVQALAAFMSATEFDFQFEGALSAALETYADSAADFADCLHASLCGVDGHEPLCTFDAKAAKISGICLLTT